MIVSFSAACVKELLESLSRRVFIKASSIKLDLTKRKESIVWERSRCCQGFSVIVGNCTF